MDSVVFKIIVSRNEFLSKNCKFFEQSSSSVDDFLQFQKKFRKPAYFSWNGYINRPSIDVFVSLILNIIARLVGHSKQKAF